MSKNKCLLCKRGVKEDSEFCWHCEVERIKGNVVIMEIGVFKIRTGRFFIVTPEEMTRAYPPHKDSKYYFMKKKDFNRNIKNLGLNVVTV